jgi:STE24 endopeptidase
MLNAYAVVVLTALVAEYALSVVIDLLNLRAMRAELPAEFRDVYDAETYRKSQKYSRVRASFGLLPRSFNLLLVLVFWFSSGFAWLDHQLRSLGLGPLLTGLMFFGALLLGQALLDLPFRIYSTFGIEARFGFNRTTGRTFVSDILKATALAVVLGGALGALLLVLFEHAGSLAWLYCWAVTTLLALLLQFIAPTWLMPLFIKFTPLQDGALRSRILEYARSVAFPLENLFVVDGSRRSSKANAFFTGFGAHRRIGLFDTLIERHTPDELIAIVAHEVGHYKKKHVLHGMLVSILQMGLMLWLFGFLMRQPALYAAFFVREPSVYMGLTLCGILYTPVSVLLSLMQLARSRRQEYEADRFAIETTGLRDALAQGLKKLTKDSLGNLTPHPSYVFLHYTHPPITARIAAIQRSGR